MQFAVVLAFVATALAAPSSTSTPPPPDGICADIHQNPDGSWYAVDCPSFQLPPGSECTVVKGNPDLPFPGCVSFFFFFLLPERERARERCDN